MMSLFTVIPKLIQQIECPSYARHAMYVLKTLSHLISVPCFSRHEMLSMSARESKLNHDSYITTSMASLWPALRDCSNAPYCMLICSCCRTASGPMNTGSVEGL